MCICQNCHVETLNSFTGKPNYLLLLRVFSKEVCIQAILKYGFV